jgi:hypothetical protein
MALTTVDHNATKDWRSQGVVATTSLIFSNGVIQLSVSRGRPLSWRATRLSSACE